jgi:hypothetical protein
VVDARRHVAAEVRRSRVDLIQRRAQVGVEAGRIATRGDVELPDARYLIRRYPRARVTQIGDSLAFVFDRPLDLRRPLRVRSDPRPRPRASAVRAGACPSPQRPRAHHRVDPRRAHRRDAHADRPHRRPGPRHRQSDSPGRIATLSLRSPPRQASASAPRRAPSCRSGLRPGRRMLRPGRSTRWRVRYDR